MPSLQHWHHPSPEGGVWSHHVILSKILEAWVCLTWGRSHISITSYKISTVHYLHGELDLAMEYFQTILQIERKAYGNSHAPIGQMLNDTGNINLWKGNISNMLEAFSEVLRIWLRAGLSPNNLDVVGVNLYAFESSYPEAAAAV